jgi:hypothetical protein
MCQPAPVVERFGIDVAEHFLIPRAYNVPGPGGVFLGSVGDQAHATRKSSHNCGAMQEDGDYADEFAHAWDCRPKTAVIGYALVKATARSRTSPTTSSGTSTTTPSTCPSSRAPTTTPDRSSPTKEQTT